MRKHDIRKWVHAILDLLPLFVIPIFAIYTRNENYNSNIELEVQESEYINFNQLLNNEDYSRTIDDTFTLTCENNIYYATGTMNRSWYNIKSFTNLTFYVGHTYLLQQNPSLNTSLDGVYGQFSYSRSGTNVNLTLTQPRRFEWLDNYTFSGFVLMYGNANFNTNQEFTLGLYDLTQMYGSGNEPSIDEFNAIFTNAYYPYTISETMRIDGITKTYNDTDVGSQFVYTLYNATDKYFNCTNLFNLEQVWNWVQLNLFSGNAPLIVYVVWQVIVYELFMDILFLIYMVFMFVIDFAESGIDRFMKRGCK